MSPMNSVIGLNGDAGRHWAELDYLPDDAIDQREDTVRRMHYFANRVARKHGAPRG